MSKARQGEAEAPGLLVLAPARDAGAGAAAGGPSSHPAEADARLRPIDRLVGSFAVLSALALIFPGRPAAWPLLLAVHLFFAALLLPSRLVLPRLRAAALRAPRVAAILAHWYPLVLLPAAYAEASVLNVAVHGGAYFDEWILRAEVALFGTQPSQTFAGAVPSLVLSEVLHASYISYYLLIYGPPLLLFAYAVRAGTAPRQFHAALVPVMAAFFFCCLWFIYFPVQGPRYLFPPPDGGLRCGPVCSLTRYILASGSSRGTAFPSSHAAVAVAQTAMGFFLLPRLSPLLLVLTVGLCFGAVYGGYHYATDMIVGAIVGLAAAALAGRAGGRRPGPLATHAFREAAVPANSPRR